MGVEVKLLVVEYQPLQPYGDRESPCSDVFADGCKGGFAAQAAVVRHNKGDNFIAIGTFLAASALIESHPRWIELNYDLYSNASFDTIFLRDPDQFSNEKRVNEAVKLLHTGNINVVASNIAEDKKPFRGYLRHHYIKSPIPGVKIAVMNVWPESHWYSTLSDDLVIKNALTLRVAESPTHVVLYAPTPLTLESVVRFANSGAFDVICYTERRSTSTPPPANVTSIIANETSTIVFIIRVEQLYHRVDDIGLIFDDTTNQLVQVTSKSHSTANLDDRYKDSFYMADMNRIQSLVTEASVTDEIIGISELDMPPGSYVANGIKYSPCWIDECELGTLLTSSMRVPRQVDFAFANGGSIELGWSSGNVKTSSFPLAFPYKNTFCYFTATAAEISKILEDSVVDVATDGTYNRTAAVPGRFLQASGIKYTFNPSLERGQRITKILTPDENGIWSQIDMFKTFSVVSNNFLCAGGDNYDFTPANGTTIELTQTDSLGTVMSHFREQSPYTPNRPKNIEVDLQGVHVKYAKQSSDCNITEKYNPLWEVCVPCIPGFYHPVPGSHDCIVQPLPPGAETSPIIYVISSVVVFLVFVAVASLYVIQRQKAQIRALIKYAPTEGKIAFVFTDIQSSSKLWGEYPQEMSIALDLHHVICRYLIKKYHGYEVKTIGDAFMIAFSCPIDAANFNCELQIKLYEAEWPPSLLRHSACEYDSGKFNGLRVRSGMHYGDCVVKETPSGGYDYEGNVVNTTARVSDSGGGGQVVITEDAYKAIEEHLTDIEYNIDCKYLGEYSFNGISDPIACIQALPEQLSGRKFCSLRNAKAVEATQETKQNQSDADGVSVGTSVFGERGELLEATQSLRRYIGQDGISLVTACELLLIPMQQGLVPDFKMLSALMNIIVYPSTAPRSQNNEKDRKENYLTVSTADKPSENVKWNSFNKIISRLPTSAVVVMAQQASLGITPQRRTSRASKESNPAFSVEV